MNCTATAAFAAGLLTFVTSSAANACSKVPVSIQRWSESTVLFIGRAGADTARTGPGDVKYEIMEGHFGRAGDRVIHGQFIEVDSLSTVDRKLLPAGVKRVVLVPWDYGADCTSTPWTRSARWIRPGTRGIYHASLRNKSHWLNGVPVLDVYSPEYVPYTGLMRPGMRSFSAESAILGIDELYDAVEHLPDPAAMKLDPIAASEPFLEWARMHPETIKRQPLNEIIRTSVYMMRAQYADRLSNVFEGTFRFVVAITGERDREFFLRTSEMGATSWNLGRDDHPSAPDDITRMNPVNGLELYITVGLKLAELPATCFNRDMNREAYIETGLKSVRTASGERAWPGQIGWGVVNVALGKDPVLAEFKGVWDGERATRFRADGPSAGSRIFFGDETGVTSVRDEYVLANGRKISLRGERISKQVQTCPRN